MKKVLSLILAGVLVLSLTACNGAELDEKQAEIDALKAQITDLEDEKGVLEEQVDTLTALVSIGNNNISELQETIDSNVKVISDLANEISSRNSEIGDLEDQIEDLEEELEIASTNTETQTEIITSFQETIETLYNEKTSLENEISELESQKETLEADVLNATSAIAALVSEKEMLFEALHTEMVNDNLILVSYEDYNGDLRNTIVGFDNDYEGSLFDLLIEKFDVTYSETEYGRMLLGFEHLEPLNGSFIAFYKNNEMSWVGLDEASFTDGDHIHFEISFWDTREQAVEDTIQLFLDNYAATYVNATTVDYTVISALNLLGLTSDYVTQVEVETLVEGLTLETTSDYFKAVARLNAVGSSDAVDLIEAFAPLAKTGAWGETAYALITLNSATSTADYTTFETDALAFFDTNTPYDAGLDTGGIDLVALAKYADDADVQALIDAYTTWIQTEQLENGGVMTRDMGWGSNVNAATTAQIIMALIANGENPAGMDYTNNMNTLVDALLLFVNEDGSFNWLEGDTTADLMFSTPQAFLALVMYQTYSNNEFVAIQPFDAH